jgi:hypothetical protein
MKTYSVVLVVVLAHSIGCARSQAPQTETISKIDEKTVDFAYVLHGETRWVSDLQGKPLTLVLMRTSDIPSQVYMAEVKEAFRAIAGITGFLVLTIEPSESPFVDLYAESEDLPFPIGIAEEKVLLGMSPLGKIPLVPTTYFLDANGKLKDTLLGVVQAQAVVQAALRLKNG